MRRATLATCRSSLLLGLLALAGCPDRGPRESGEKRTWAFEKTFDGGPVRLTLRLDRTEISLSDRLTLEEVLQISPGFEAEFPEYLPEDFEGFAVVEIHSQAPRGEGTGAPAAQAMEEGSDAPAAAAGGASEPPPPGAPRVLRKTLRLEPERSGTLAIAPLAVYFHEEGEKKESHFLTEEIPVTVKPLEDAGSLEVPPPREIFAAPPGARGRGILWLAAGLLALALAAALLWYVKRRPRRAPPPTPPEEIAWEALRRLVAQDFSSRGEVELFFVHLSAILRQYVENRFGVHAPERTTEEFLEEAARAPQLAGHRERPGEFLKLSDQVKFALYRPETAAIQRSFDVVKQFIQETATHAHRGA